MNEVLTKAARAADGFQSEAVHDLRVALRRCRSMADGFRALDPHKDWKKMRRQAAALFDSLGDLRDLHVMMEWVAKLGPENDPATRQLVEHLQKQESELTRQAERAIEEFDSRQWQSLARSLPPRAERLPAGSEVFQALALEKLNAARRLHGPAMKTQADSAFHRLRIGVKKFRYVVENFLPQHHQEWRDGLKHAQDTLGEIHDLDVLREAVLTVWAGEAPAIARNWEEKLERERQARIEQYRESMARENSLWQVWRSSLPRGRAAREASLKKLHAWSAFLESDLQHNKRVARFAVQIHDSLAALGLLEGANRNSRELLRAAATVHEVGRAGGDKNHHKKTERMIGQLHHLVGWTRQEVATMASVARHHRGALPQAGTLRDLPPAQRKAIKLLAGILRLANALDDDHDGSIRRIRISREAGFVVLHAQGFRPESPLAEKIAGARHLLETTCGVPILVRSMPKQTSRARMR